MKYFSSPPSFLFVATCTVIEFVVFVRNIKVITEEINQISEQTNLLALNASIESSRVGDIGKGFAVVSIEIKNLADSSSELTNDINKIVEGLEHNTYRTKDEVNQVIDALEEEYITMCLELFFITYLQILLKSF